MHDDFRVARGLKDGALTLKLGANLVGICDIAVVRQGNLSLAALDATRKLRDGRKSRPPRTLRAVCQT